MYNDSCEWVWEIANFLNENVFGLLHWCSFWFNNLYYSTVCLYSTKPIAHSSHQQWGCSSVWRKWIWRRRTKIPTRWPETMNYCRKLRRSWLHSRQLRSSSTMFVRLSLCGWSSYRLTIVWRFHVWPPLLVSLRPYASTRISYCDKPLPSGMWRGRLWRRKTPKPKAIRCCEFANRSLKWIHKNVAQL